MHDEFDDVAMSKESDVKNSKSFLITDLLSTFKNYFTWYMVDLLS